MDVENPARRGALALFACLLVTAAAPAPADSTVDGASPPVLLADGGWQYGYDPYRRGRDRGLTYGGRRGGKLRHRDGGAAQPFSRHRVPPGSHDSYRSGRYDGGAGDRFDRNRGRRHGRDGYARGRDRHYGQDRGYGRDRRYGRGRGHGRDGFGSAYGYDRGRGAGAYGNYGRRGYGYGQRGGYRPRYSPRPDYRNARPRSAPGYVPHRD